MAATGMVPDNASGGQPIRSNFPKRPALSGVAPLPQPPNAPILGDTAEFPDDVVGVLAGEYLRFPQKSCDVHPNPATDG